MGYIQQSRANPALGLYAESLARSYGRMVYTGAISTGSQVTFSYRTGRAVEAIEDEGSSLDNVKTLAGEFAPLKSEYNRGPRNEYDNGHTFWTTNQKVEFLTEKSCSLHGNPSGSSTDKAYWYTGPVTMDPTTFSVTGYQTTFPSVPGARSTTDVNKDGTHAISVTTPTLPVAGLNVALAEIVRDGIPHMIGSSLLALKNSAKGLLGHPGDEYLNVEFGWKPLVSDIKKACHAILAAQKLLTQLERDSGRVVRRSYTYPADRDSFTVVGQANRYRQGDPIYTNAYDNMWSASRGNCTLTVNSETKRWFKGAYTYHLSGDSNPSGKVKRAAELANYLLGIELSPDVLWQLQPWSWFADWFANIGDVLSNATRLTSDGLVIRYGYLMCEQRTSWTRTLTGISTHAGGTLPALVLRTSCYRKERFKATPFGFGINATAFSPWQWSILGALGMTRAPQTLR